jgi:hypothetical protein
MCPGVNPERMGGVPQIGRPEVVGVQRASTSLRHIALMNVNDPAPPFVLPRSTSIA